LRQLEEKRSLEVEEAKLVDRRTSRITIETLITIGKPMKDAVTQEALSRIDRMSSETFMVHA